MLATKTFIRINEETVRLWIKQGRDFDWTCEGIETAVEAVNKGAALLDEKRPQWVDQIIPDKLDMANGEFCIIGQTYGEYDEYIGVPFGDELIEFGAHRRHEDEAMEHGFYDQDGVPFPLLDRVWVYMLTARKESGKRLFLLLPTMGS